MAYLSPVVDWMHSEVKVTVPCMWMGGVHDVANYKLGRTRYIVVVTSIRLSHEPVDVR